MKVESSISLFEQLRGYRHQALVLDYNFGFLLIFLTACTLTTPLSPGWRLFRQSIAGPLIALGWLYCAWIPYVMNDSEQWEVTVFMMAFCFRALELLVFFPADENVFRINTAGIQAQSKGAEANGKPHGMEQPQLVSEPVPQPFTFAKFCWAMSLCWSWRGIGWNYCCPLPYSAQRHPYNRTSSRRDYVKTRLINTLLLWISWDVFRTITNLSPAASYLSPQTAPGLIRIPEYRDWNILEKTICSIIIPARIVIDTEKTHLMMSVVFVSIGGYMGWEGEIWSPYGWPPLFGSFGDLFRYPGLATMWSRTWQGYFRRWLHVLAWIGIGENILGLTHSGQSAHPPTIKTSPNGSNESNGSTNPEPLLSTPTPSPSPIGSGRTSPSHPLPSSSKSPRPKLTAKLAFSNFAKSLIVFTLSGLLHDCGTYSLLLLNTPLDRSAPAFRQAFVLTPFFVAQPFALIAEALLKVRYRKWKSRVYPQWKEKGYPRYLIIGERTIGFALTWIWLGWSAGWFVEGLTKSGMFSREVGRPMFPSLLGGWVWGKWWH